MTLRQRIAAFLNPPVPAVTTEPKPFGVSIAALERLKAADVRPVWREFKLPELPAGVVPTSARALAADNSFLCNDEAPRLALDWGGQTAPDFGYLNAAQGAYGYGFMGYPYLAQLTQISEYRAPCEVTSTEMTRKWLKITNVKAGDNAEKIDEIEARFKELNVRDVCRQAAAQVDTFGRSQIYINVDNANDLQRQKPLLIEDGGGVAVGKLTGIKVIEPYWSTPFSYNSTRPENEDFYKPESWYILGRKTHSTRLLTMVSREVPDMLKPSYNFGGIPLLQLMEPYINRWLRSAKSVNDLINIFSIVNLSTDMASVLEGGDAGGLIRRAELFTQQRDNRGMMLTNHGTEELTIQNAALSGLDKLQAQAQEHMAAPCHIPLVKLFGVVPTGLNATSEGEIQVWYDYVKAMQVNLFGPVIDTLLKVVQLDLYGSIDDAIGYEWVPLDEPTAKELSEIRGSDATAGASYINAGVISPDEERERLQRDPLSGYDNLSGPAPEPPQDVDADGNPIDPDAPPEDDDTSGDDAAAANREHESDESDKQREHESSEADKDRAHQLKLAAKA